MNPVPPSESAHWAPETDVCYYAKAMRLKAIAEELLEDPRASRDGEVLKTSARLLSLVADIREDNPICWDFEGHCPRCPNKDQIED